MFFFSLSEAVTTVLLAHSSPILLIIMSSWTPSIIIATGLGAPLISTVCVSESYAIGWMTPADNARLRRAL